MDKLKGADEVYTERVRAGKRTYYFDIRETKSSDFYITITESKRKPNGRGYEKHKIFLYKEDFNRFLAALQNTIGYVKSDLLPDYDFDAYQEEQGHYDGYSEDGYEAYPSDNGNDYGNSQSPASRWEDGDSQSLTSRWED